MKSSSVTEMNTSSPDVICETAPDPRFQMRTVISSGHRSLHSMISFTAEQSICKFEAMEEVESPNYLSVQVSKTNHIMLSPSFLEWINHSCNPNIFFDVTSAELIAVKEIAEGDELTFFYPSTEWKMSQPFECLCKTHSCLKSIQGAA